MSLRHWAGFLPPLLWALATRMAAWGFMALNIKREREKVGRVKEFYVNLHNIIQT